MSKKKSRDHYTRVAYNDRAPTDERRDAQTQMMKANMPVSSSDLLMPPEHMRPVIEQILNWREDMDMNKAVTVLDPGLYRSQRKKSGMQSLDIDDFQITINGDYMDRPGALDFMTMRAMVDNTPILSAVVQTRIRQVNQFCQIQEAGNGPGFVIRHRNRDHNPSTEEKQSIELLQSFMDNCGWEFNPRRRRQLKRDTFSQFMSKVVRDTLTMDSAAIETEWKRDKRLGIDGFYAVDGSSIRLCSESGYRGDDEIFALQVVSGIPRTAYTFEDLIYEPRNPRSDLLACGYGMSETEMLIKVVTGWLNAMTYNNKFFDSNAIPRGMLHLTGNYDNKDIEAFKRYWNAMVKGINNAWSLPVMVSKDQESKAAFERFNADVDEMMFSKWMTFLTSIICAIYGMAPEEINSEGFSAGKSSLSGSDTKEKLTDSRDKGLKPVLGYFQNLFTDYIIRDFSDKYVFRFTGLDDEDKDREWEADKMALKWNELRAARNMEPDTSPLGDAPLNPSLIGPWLQMQQQQQPEDFGTPESEGQEQDGQSQEQSQEPADDKQGTGDSVKEPESAQQRPPQPGNDMAKAFDITTMAAPIIFEVKP